MHMFDSDNDGVLTKEELVKAFTFYTPDDIEIIDEESVQVIIAEMLRFSSDPKKNTLTLSDLTKFIQETDIDKIPAEDINLPANPLKQ